MKIFAICVIAASIAAVTAVPHVEEQVYKDLAEKGRITAILHFKGASNAEVRAKFRAEYHATGKAFNHDTLPDLLTANANKHQAKTLDFLKSRQLAKGAAPNFLQLWISNQIAVHDMDLELLNELKKSDEVTYIEANREYQLLNNVEVNEASTSTDGPHIFNTDGPHILQNQVQWGVADVGAPEVWQQGFTGQGIVVGIIDTGVRRSHEILRDNYRRDYGWLDATVPISLFRSRRPRDDQGHGSHCTGSIVGKKGYGVAPDAKWIACKGLTALGTGGTAALLECGQFMACPTDPYGNNKDCSKRPNIISNSWGSDSSTRFYDDIIKTWIDNGQIPVFANGNAGDKCSSTGSPADYGPAISVGATNSSNKVAKFSSRGPTQAGLRKPDVSAPGQNITSAGFLTDSSYQTFSGTSMATPHVAGIAALYLSKNPNLTVNQMRELLEQSSIPTAATGQTCGDISDDVYPNNAVGYGKVYAPRGISMI